MRRYDPGDAVSLRHVVEDLDGVRVAAEVTLTAQPRGGEPVDITVITESTGVYDATIQPGDLTTLGPYDYEWTVTGPVEDTVTGSFYVGAADDGDELPPVVSFGKLAAKIGYVPVESERVRAEEILDEASELIRDEAGRTWADPTTGEVSGVPRRVRTICVEAAYRAFMNPEGLSQRSIGDSSKSYDRAQREGGEIVYLTAAERRAIRKASGGSTMRVVTLEGPYGGPLLDPWAEATAQ